MIKRLKRICGFSKKAGINLLTSLFFLARLEPDEGVYCFEMAGQDYR